MNNFVKTALILSVTLFAANADAGVRSIVDSPTHTHRDVLKGDAGLKIRRMCNNRGYTKTNCKRNEVALEFCPQNSSYFKYCCPEGFSSTAEECYEAGMEPSSRSCHGYYRCEMPEEVSEKDDYINDYDKELSSEEDNYRNDYNEEYSSEEERHEEDDTIRRERVHPIFRTQQIQ